LKEFGGGARGPNLWAPGKSPGILEPFLGLDNDDPGPVEVIVISHNREPGSQKKGRGTGNMH